ncbi:MAG: hypothetical protein ABIN01_18015 [Ferruginibacter sp.]
MKYYLVNYIILNKNIIIENQHIGIPLFTFANINDFKKTIAAKKSAGPEIENIVIKSYQEISKEAFYSLDTVTQ